MFATYDFTQFSKRIKRIRISMGYTIRDVSISTGINPSTINKIENGKTIPRYDTLAILSTLYKCDLISIFYHDSNDDLSINLHRELVSISVSGNIELLNDILDKIKNYSKNNELSAVEQKGLTQLKLYAEGLVYASNSHKPNSPEINCAINKYSEALLILNPLFSLEFFERYKYTSTEINILYSIALMLGLRRECELSNDIFFFVKEHFSLFSSAFHNYTVLLSKIYYSISYNYHRMDIHQKALEYAESGIKYCNSADTHLYIPLLLGRKGIALRNLNSDHWKNPILNAITLLEIQERPHLIKMYRDILSTD